MHPVAGCGSFLLSLLSAAAVAPSPQAHASMIAEMPKGTLTVAWFGGCGEGKPGGAMDQACGDRSGAAAIAHMEAEAVRTALPPAHPELAGPKVDFVFEAMPVPTSEKEGYLVFKP